MEKCLGKVSRKRCCTLRRRKSSPSFSQRRLGGRARRFDGCVAMFRKFSKQESVSSFAQVKTSVQRGIRANICAQYPILEDGGTIDLLIPKKENVVIAKW